MAELLKLAGSNAALVALAAIALANVIIWFAGGSWTPQKRAYVGIAAVLGVCGLWYWANAASFPSTREGIVVLVVGSLVLVLAAAGAPVMKETFVSGSPSEPPASLEGIGDATPAKKARTWGVWSNPKR